MTVLQNVLLADVYANIPAAAAGNESYFFFATDTEKLYRSNGTTWVQVAAGVGEIGAITGDLDFDGNKGINLGDPTSAQDAATKTYVDGIATNLGKRARVRAATTANITISTALNNGDTLDGVTLATGDLVLVKDQTVASGNGVYIVGVVPIRATEFDTYDEYPGSLIAVEEGTINTDTLWLCVSNVGGVLETNDIDFAALATSAAVEDLTTAETDDTLVLAPDGVGGVAWVTPSGGGVGGGALVLIEQHEASASAALDFTSFISALYDEYVFEFINIVPATDAVGLLMRMSTDGGSSYDAGSVYQSTYIEHVAAGEGYGGSDTGTLTSIQLVRQITNSADYSANGRCTLFAPGGSRYKAVASHFHARYASGDNRSPGSIVDGMYQSTTAVDAIRFLMSSGNIASGIIRVYGISKSGGASGTVVQVVHATDSAVATGTTGLPFDDSIPQSNEGDQFMSLAITPKNASNYLLVEVNCFVTLNASEWAIMALFQDSVTDALAATAEYESTGTAGGPICLRYRMVAGTTSPTTFKVRIGRPASGTVTFNGQSGNRMLGGVAASTITISEIAA